MLLTTVTLAFNSCAAEILKAKARITVN